MQVYIKLKSRYNAQALNGLPQKERKAVWTAAAWG